MTSTACERLRTRWARAAASGVLVLTTQDFSRAQDKSGQPREASAAQLQKRADELLYEITAGAPGFSQIVKGKPFEAEAITETVRVLQDGNRIVHHNTIKQYRDNDGRTRREMTIEALGPSSGVHPKLLIFVNDPVSGVNFVEDPQAKTVRKSRAGSRQIGGVGDATSNKEADEQNSSRMSGTNTNVRVTDLGKRTIEGLDCIGKRTTHIFPAGSVGNQGTFIATTETWFSPEIEAVVESASFDPRFGKTTYALRRVKRAEPPAQLFAIPQDYRVLSEGPGTG
jgi:hypothetical protein